jgi:imidazolonepropionase-like amidohydrolase
MRLWRLLLITLLAVTAQAQTSGSKQATRDGMSGVTAFVGVNVIPMDRERVLKNQTVVVRGGRIAEVGDAAKVKVPSGALAVEGRGKWLLPGLTDMHTHLFSDDEFPDSLAADELAVMIANGVTTARLMIGTPEHLVLRERVAKGELLGPALYVASPQLAGKPYGKIFNGYVVTTPDEARRAVRESRAAGYDFIKLTTAISPAVYDAVIEEAKALGIRVVGHVDLRVGLRRALAAGQQIEHLDSYMEAVLRDDAPMKESVSDYGVWRKPNWESLDYVDERKVAEMAKATARAGVYTCPTLTFFKLSFAVEQSDDEIRARPDYRFYPEKLRAPLFGAHTRFWTAPPTPERRAKYVRVRNQLVKGIHDAGGKIMAGSDTPELFLVYGFTLHRELKSLVEAGLSPYAALAAATRTPAEYLRGLDTFGTVEKGRRADLILLDANPLEDITNTERRAGVMSRGRWLSAAELQQMLDGIAPRFQKALEGGKQNP